MKQQSSYATTLVDAGSFTSRSITEMAEHVFGLAFATDRRTGTVVAQSRDAVLAKICEGAQRGSHPFPEDRLMHIVRFSIEALRQIMEHPTERRRRNYVLAPPYRVRAFDQRSLAWLARQPGRTRDEKLASARKLLTPQGRLDFTTAENRVVRRFAGELAKRVRDRLAGAGRYDSDSDDERVSLLRGALHVTTEDLAASPLDAIKPAIEIRANNVLVSHPQYGKIWRASRWLRELIRDEVRRPAGTEIETAILRAIFWIAVAELRVRYGLVLPEAAVFADNNPVRSDFGVTQLLSPQEAGAPRAGHAIRLWDGRHVPPRLVSLWVDRRHLHVEEVIYPEPRSAALGKPSKGEPGAHHVVAMQRSGADALTALIRTKGGRRLEVRATPGLDALRACALRLVGLIDGLDKVKAESEPDLPQAPRHIGWDPLGATARLSTDVPGWEELPSRCLQVAVLERSEKDASPWLTLRRGSTVDITSKHVEIVPLATAFADDPSREELAALDQVVTDLIDGIPRRESDFSGPAGATDLGCAVPDALDELGRHRLRQMLAPHAARAKIWLLDRSLVAAIGFEDDFGAGGPGPGDAVMVLDTACAPILASMLTLEELAGPGAAPRRRVWRRDLRFASRSAPDGMGDPREAYLQLLLGRMPPTAVSSADMARRLCTTGQAETLIGMPGVRSPHPIELLIKQQKDRPPLMVRLVHDEQLYRQVATDWCRSLTPWIKGFDRWDAFRELFAKHADTRLHVLVIGPCADQGLLQEQVLKTLAAAAPAAGKGRFAFHAQRDPAVVSRGARNFLQRQACGEPCAIDVLPDLFLETADKPFGIRIFASGERWPGETIDSLVPEPAVLPAGSEQYLFPMWRGGHDLTELPYEASLKSSIFPLKRATRVQLRVKFDYGSDDFRLLVQPLEAQAPFRELQVAWARHPPSLSGKDRSEGRRPTLVCPPEDPARAATARARLGDAVSRLLRAVPERPDRIIELLDRDIGPALANLLRHAPAQTCDIDRSLVERLVAWAELDPPKTPADPALRDAARICLGYLGSLAPEAFLRVLPAYIDERQTAGRRPRDRFNAIGHALGDGTGVRRVALKHLLALIARRIKENPNIAVLDVGKAARALHPLRALAIALWIEPGLALALAQEAESGTLIEGVDRLIERMIDWLQRDLLPADDTREAVLNAIGATGQRCCEILLALLTCEELQHAPDFVPGNPACRKRARNVRILDFYLRGVGTEIMSHRLRSADAVGVRLPEDVSRYLTNAPDAARIEFVMTQAQEDD